MIEFKEESRSVNPGNTTAVAHSKESNCYIAPCGLYNFSSLCPGFAGPWLCRICLVSGQSLSKRVGGYSHTRLPGGLEAESSIIVLTDGIEDETEEINGMGSGDSTHVCISHLNLKGYKDWVGDWIDK